MRKSNWESFPNRGEHEQYLKAPTSLIFCETNKYHDCMSATYGHLSLFFAQMRSNWKSKKVCTSWRQQISTEWHTKALSGHCFEATEELKAIAFEDQYR